MPVGIRFVRETSRRFIEALSSGQPVEPGPEGWTVDASLALAGACYFLAMSHGPLRLSDREWDDLPLEHREAAEGHFLADLGFAV